MFKWLLRMFDIKPERPGPKPFYFINQRGNLELDRERLYASEGFKRQLKACEELFKHIEEKEMAFQKKPEKTTSKILPRPLAAERPVPARREPVNAVATKSIRPEKKEKKK